jgi:hypothetical protein
MTVTALAFVLAVVGVLLISYVQAGIIRTEGFMAFRQKGFATVYWRERSAIQRWCFFLGLGLLGAPFIIFGLLAITNAVAV